MHQLVPYKVVQLRHFCEGDKNKYECSVGDILILLPSKYANHAIFNVTRETIMSHNKLDDTLVVRAYEVAQIIITQDNEPAPYLGDGK